MMAVCQDYVSSSGRKIFKSHYLFDPERFGIKLHNSTFEPRLGVLFFNVDEAELGQKLTQH